MSAQQVTTVQGVEVPSLGLGTWQVTGEACAEAVRHAIELGYRHLDTARAYGNEAEVARGIAQGGVDRAEIFLTTKIWRSELAPARLRRAAEDSLRNLRTDYLDLLLLHWPSRDVPLGAQLEALTRLRDDGKIRQLGVSNFPAGMLREAVGLAPVFCNQIEYHPFLDQSELVELAAEHDLLLTAYSPIAQGEVLDDPVLVEIAEAHGKTPVQVALRWLLDKPNVAAIPRSTSAANREANAAIFDFALTPRERSRVDALARGRRLVDPPFAPDWAA